MDHESSVQNLVCPRGVTIRIHRSGQTSIQIAFPYKGHHCREVLKGREATKTNIRFAADLVARIRSEIAEGSFEYLKYFPKSKRARAILGRRRHLHGVGAAR